MNKTSTKSEALTDDEAANEIGCTPHAVLFIMASYGVRVGKRQRNHWPAVKVEAVKKAVQHKPTCER